MIGVDFAAVLVARWLGLWEWEQNHSTVGRPPKLTRLGIGPLFIRTNCGEYACFAAIRPAKSGCRYGLLWLEHRIHHQRQHFTGEAANARPLAFARACHIQDLHIVLAQPRENAVHHPLRNHWDGPTDETGLARLLSKDLCGQSAAIQFTNIDDQRRVAVGHVATGTLPVATLRYLHELILGRNDAVFGQASMGEPTHHGYSHA